MCLRTSAPFLLAAAHLRPASSRSQSQLPLTRFQNLGAVVIEILRLRYRTVRAQVSRQHGAGAPQSRAALWCRGNGVAARDRGAGIMPPGGTGARAAARAVCRMAVEKKRFCLGRGSAAERRSTHPARRVPFIRPGREREQGKGQGQRPGQGGGGQAPAVRRSFTATWSFLHERLVVRTAQIPQPHCRST